ncbi:hypothetical protein GCM10010220_68080 [Streptomyces parvulus]|nr:hypothetical protein GCM10010220_68080 [Streptomyces parvulus]
MARVCTEAASSPAGACSTAYERVYPGRALTELGIEASALTSGCTADGHLQQ